MNSHQDRSKDLIVETGNQFNYLHEEEIHLIDYLNVIKKHIWLILGVIAFSFIGTSTYLYFSEDIYQATATIMPVQGKKKMSIPLFKENKEFDMIKNLLSSNLPALYQDTTTTTIRAVLESRDFNLHLVEKYNLLPKLFDELWDEKNAEWKVENRSRLFKQKNFFQKVFGFDGNKYTPTPIDGALLLIDQKVSIENARNSKLLQVNFEDENPVFCANMLNIYLLELDNYLRSREIQRLSENQKHLENILSTHKDSDIAKGIKELLLNQVEAIMYAKGASSFMFQVFDRPLIPQQNIWPNRLRTLILSFILSLFFGIGLTFFLEYLKKGKETKT